MVCRAYARARRCAADPGGSPTSASAAENAATRLDVRDQTLAWLGSLATAGRIRLVGHDPGTTTEVAALAARGATVAEFPTTAAAARRHGLYVLAGAPNVLRGGSHSGNVSAGRLVAEGLVDALASDYLPAALLAAATELVRRGLGAAAPRGGPGYVL